LKTWSTAAPPSEEVAQAEVEVGKRMQAIAALIAALRAKKLRLAFGSVS